MWVYTSSDKIKNDDIRNKVYKNELSDRQDEEC